MTDLFFYGTLCHAPLLAVVLGRGADGAAPPDIAAAQLPDYAVYEVRDQPFPLIRSEPGGRADGVLVRGLNKADLARLEFYEGGFGYDLCAVSVRLEGGQVLAAEVFIPKPDLWPVGQPWSLDRWVAKWGDMSVCAAVEVMDQYGMLTRDEIARRFPGIRYRAAARVAAQGRGPDPGQIGAGDVAVHAHHRRYSNFFAAEEMDLQYRRYDGTLSPVLNRGAQMLGQATVVLPYDPQKDAVLMVEQFRAPVFMGGDPNPWVWEPVSGLIDPGETAEAAARREAMEEAGLTLGHMERVGGCYSSTGANSEFVHLFVGLADFETRSAGGGLAGEGEDIRTGVVAYDEFLRDIDLGLYRDMPLTLCAHWLARHRDRLRKAG